MNLAFLGLLACMLAASLGTSSANVALPTLARAFGASFGAVQWVVIGYLLATTSAIVVFGKLGDVVGRRRSLRAAVGLYCAGSVAASVGPVLGVVIAARVVQGVGAAGMMALSVAFVGELAAPERTGRAMGVLATTSSIGTALGPTLGGVLVATAGWRAIFLVQAVLGAAALVWIRRLPPDPAGRRGSLDPRSAASFAGALAAFTLAVTLARARLDAAPLALLGVAALGLAMFVRAERAAEDPLLQRALFADGARVAGLAATAVVSCVVMTSMVVGPFYLARGLGLDPRAVGLTMSVGSVVAALTGVPAGRLVDRLGARRATLLGLAGIAAAAAALRLRPETLGVPGYVAPMAWLTASYALFQVANNTGLLDGVPAAQRGVAAGTLSLFRNLGLVTGACVMGAVFAYGVGAQDPAAASRDAVAQGLRTSYALAALLIAAAFVAVASIRTNRKA